MANRNAARRLAADRAEARYGRQTDYHNPRKLKRGNHEQGETVTEDAIAGYVDYE